MMRKEVLDWLNAAEDDPETAKILFSQEVYYACAFYCQQASEKALKAIFILKNNKGSQLHNIIALAEDVSAPEKIVSACRKINPHYVQTRYPDAANAIPKDAYSDEMAEELLEKAKEVFEWAEKQTSK